MAEGFPSAAGLGSAQFVQRAECPELSRAVAVLVGSGLLQLSYFCALNYAGKVFMQHHIVFVSSAAQRSTNPTQKLLAEDCLGRGGGGFVLFVGSVCWFKAIMLRGLLIGKAGVLLMIAVFGK